MTVPTLGGNMTKVDGKGRIVLPKRVRDRLGIEPGTEVEVREEGGKAVVEPEGDPQEIIERMEELVAETSPADTETTPLDAENDPIARRHRHAVRRGAEQSDDE